MYQEDSDFKYPHRKIMARSDNYVPIKDIIMQMRESGDPSTDAVLYTNIVEDPRIVSICGECRIIDVNTKIIEEVLRLTSSFSDQTAIVCIDDNEFVQALDLYIEYRKDLESLNILNQFEMISVLKQVDVRIYGDLVDLKSLRKITDETFPPIIEDEEPIECYDEIMDIDDGDDPIVLIREYVALFDGKMVPWDSISRNLFFSEGRLTELKPALSRTKDMLLTEEGVMFKESSESDVEPVPDTLFKEVTYQDTETVKSITMKILSDGRRRSLSDIQKKLLSEYKLKVNRIILSDCLNSMVRCKSLIRPTSQTYCLNGSDGRKM